MGELALGMPVSMESGRAAIHPKEEVRKHCFLSFSFRICNNNFKILCFCLFFFMQRRTGILNDMIKVIRAIFKNTVAAKQGCHGVTYGCSKPG